MKLVECVPNFSEGRDQEKIRAITREIEAVPGVKLLDVDPGRIDQPDGRDVHRDAGGRRRSGVPGHPEGRRSHRHARATRAPTAASARPTSARSSPSPG